jgi:putative tricarboxylic transport membrane protein
MTFMDAALEGLRLVLVWPAPGYMLLGVAIGMFFGAVPGLGGLVGMAIILPFTFGMPPEVAFAFILGMYAVTTTADTLASVLLGIPGTAASQATILDGYPMAQRGEASRALGAAYTVSMFGGVLGALFLALSIPIVRPLILSFSEPEFFALAVLGLTMVASLSGKSIYKGTAAACFGLMLACVGFAEFGGVRRYWFEQNFLLEGIPIVPYVLGLFALPEVLELAVRNTSISRVQRDEVESGGILNGMKDAAKHWWLALRCTAIGVYIGMLPGLGGSIVDWVAYGHAAQSEKNTENFGKGDIRGVIAPEAANNAMKGGALLPTIAFAIPGSASMAILLSAFFIQGLEPGPQILTTKLDITFTLIWTLVLANVAGAVILLVWGGQVSKITYIQGHIIVPTIIIVVFMGAWVGNGSLGNWIVLLIFGFIGYFMKLGGWPRPPIVLGFVLGKIMEESLGISMQIHGWNSLTRPIVIVIIILTVITIISTVRKQRKKRREEREAAATHTLEAPKDVTSAVQVAEEGGKDCPVASWPLGAILLLIFSYCYYEAIPWNFAPKIFPHSVAVVGFCLAAGALFTDWKTLKAIKAGTASPDVVGVDRSFFWKSMYFMSWMVGILVLTMVIGQFPTLILFVLLYLVFWGKFSWKVAVLYLIGIIVFLLGMFNEIVPVMWYEPDWLPNFFV